MPVLPVFPVLPLAPCSFASTDGEIWLVDVIRYDFAARPVPPIASTSETIAIVHGKALRDGLRSFGRGAWLESSLHRVTRGPRMYATARPLATHITMGRSQTCGMTSRANSSWFLIAIQCGAPPALTVMPISVTPSHNSRVAAMRWRMSAGVPTQT